VDATGEVRSRMQTAECRSRNRTGRAPAVMLILLGLAGLVLAGPLVVTRRIEKRIPLAGYSKAAVIHRYVMSRLSNRWRARTGRRAGTRPLPATEGLPRSSRQVDIQAAGTATRL